MSICPNARDLLLVGQVDAAAVNYVIELYTKIQELMQTKGTLKLTEKNAYALFGTQCGCGETSYCQLNICELITLVNQNGILQTFSNNFTYTLRPFAFAVTDNDTFVPIADPVFGGLVANPKLYNYDQFPTIYDKVKQNPYGVFVNFVKYHEGNRDCVIQMRCFARLLPKCFKKYGTVILMVEFPLLTAEPVATTVTIPIT